MAIEQGLLDEGGAAGVAPTVANRNTISGKRLTEDRSLADLLAAQNELLTEIRDLLVAVLSD